MYRIRCFLFSGKKETNIIKRNKITLFNNVELEISFNFPETSNIHRVHVYTIFCVLLLTSVIQKKKIIVDY